MKIVMIECQFHMKHLQYTLRVFENSSLKARRFNRLAMRPDVSINNM